MRRYYFDIRDGDEIASDEEGMELPNIERVQEEAARSLADMARDAARQITQHGDAHQMAIEVRDTDGPVMQVSFSFNVKRLRE
ncbi:hypothetical protein H8B02_26455 [Bradyrhizobium sp. Pear77]|uniref:DUF6894 family protein n=1 Tax=Bradyrhizobium altum TaxID=1571202 RepID=UPI001E5EE598|nr:hypothetical protein [Bradyrhizobium altum]MCC8956847.1 hypothetical protein [Bradyrhizobium altum]